MTNEQILKYFWPNWYRWSKHSNLIQLRYLFKLVFSLGNPIVAFKSKVKTRSLLHYFIDFLFWYFTPKCNVCSKLVYCDFLLFKLMIVHGKICCIERGSIVCRRCLRCRRCIRTRGCTLPGICHRHIRSPTIRLRPAWTDCWWRGDRQNHPGTSPYHLISNINKFYILIISIITINNHIKFKK